MMSAEPDFQAWADELDREFDRYIEVCQRNGHTPCSRETILWEARQQGCQPSALLRSRQKEKRP